ncbi:sulfotransferase [Aliiglaciecola sp. 2_MG-2023]|uniref:sulfotransferase family protein n=1 Tax=unclassified Aliiglaciecola TaxID=2593648 RepID=UPI0026E11A63|nr:MULTISPECIES: sulfotransferase family protein [unclassified Aliiglaciecola]MDO6712806.1 sulfotransferase [Aliiglaciecola sp. 2_MG-2023]MDO6753901.1 sulfotransferase [Aliiglaciecola sp. 1_MG-2023]
MTIKIIGAGMGRTGTASLKVALETLGLGQCYHMTEVLKNPKTATDWINAAEGNADWDKIFNGYTATVDNPGCNYWKELADYYPQGKVILTVRDADKWFESTSETIHSSAFAGFIKNSPFGEMVQKTVWDIMENRMDDRKYMIDFFNNRTAEIIDYIAPERLLVYKVSEGWEPLCNFLDIPVPDTEFPRINRRDETKQVLENLLASTGDEEAMVAAGHAVHKD